MIPREILEKIRRIEIVGRRRAQDLAAGRYHSVFKGQGMEFSETRPYIPGDDVRRIDWNVTARAGQPFVKNFMEERELTVLFMVDVSASGTFGTARLAKGELAAEVAAVLAFSAISNHDRVGLITFTDQIEQFIPPRKGKGHVLRLVRDLLFHQPVSSGTHMAGALDFLMRVQKKRAIVFLFSDFFDSNYERSIKAVARRHDLIACPLSDPRDAIFPQVGLVALEDPESGATGWVDTRDKAFAAWWTQRREKQRGELDRLLTRIGVDRIQLATERSYDAELVKFFKGRERRKSR